MSKALELILGASGIVFDYAGTTAPTGFLMCYGQAVSRTTYAALFAAIGTAYGAGDGSTTFNVPDCRGRVTAGGDAMGGTAAGRLNVNTTGTTTAGSAVVTAIPSTAGLSVGMNAYGTTLPANVTISSIDSATQITLSTGSGVTAGTATALRFGVVDGATLGASGGTHVQSLSSQQLPAHNHSVFLNDPGHSHATNAIYFTGANNISGGSTANLNIQSLASNSVGTGITVRDASGGGGNANQTASTGNGQMHSNTQPTLILNKIIKT